MRVLPERSNAVGDDPGIQVVDDTETKEAEHRHTERRQSNTHWRHGHKDSLNCLYFWLENKN